MEKGEQGSEGVVVGGQSDGVQEEDQAVLAVRVTWGHASRRGELFRSAGQQSA
ncbi:hypothetical protein [Streptomyces sp. NBC_01716]|uniref:hypothetical protein n=1 Tax=Streptomyces sp. NBC_01716 TaxID=2975917 RepID=UPI002E3502C2|nr:hypothetical protein [Streptomyces sp. NBC_01716]